MDFPKACVDTPVDLSAIYQAYGRMPPTQETPFPFSLTLTWNKSFDFFFWKKKMSNDLKQTQKRFLIFFNFF